MASSSSSTKGEAELRVRRHVRRYLWKLRHRELFVLGFDVDDFDKLLDEGAPPPATQKEHVFNKLMMVVARDLANGSKSERRLILQQLNSSRDQWVKEIENYDDAAIKREMENEDGATPAAIPKQEINEKAEETAPVKKKKAKKGKRKSKEVAVDENLDDENVDVDVGEIKEHKLEPKSKKGGKKRKAAASTKKGKVRKKTEEADTAFETNQAPLLSREALKQEFEEEKQRILSEIPDDVLSEFGQLGFAKWSRQYLPVMFLSPFQVPPGIVRNDWMSMYENTKGRQQNMTRLVYWYGEQNMAEAFSFIVKKNCMPYKEGVQKGHHKIKKAIQNKVDAGKKLTKAEQNLIQGLEEINAEAAKDPKDRKLPIGDFLEDYETVELEREVEVEEDEELISSDDEPPPKKGPKVPKQSDQAESMQIMEEEDFAENEVSSGEEYEDAVASEPEDDADLDYEASNKSTKSKKRKGDDVKTAKSPRKKAKKSKIDRKRSKGQSKAVKSKAEKNKSDCRKEQQKFEKCEEKYLPLETRWKSSLETKDGAQLASVMAELSHFVDSLSAAFVESYKLPQLMKETKPILKSMETEYGVYKKVWNSMKELYQVGKDKIPEDFVAKKKKHRTQATAKPAKKQEPTSDKDEKTVQPTGQRDEALPQPEEKIGSLVDERRNDTFKPMATRIPKSEEATANATVSPAMSRATSQIALDSPSKSTSQQTKSERKAFSLSHLMRPKDNGLQESEAANRNDRSTTLSRENKGAEGPPSWLTAAPETETLVAYNDERGFALEFLQAAAAQFPEGTVDQELAAKSLEDAVFKWSKARGGVGWKTAYWEKVHSLVAAIGGKREPGLLVKQILSGKYRDANDLVLASDDVLKRSFGE